MLNKNRWIILITGTLMLLFLGLIYGWSIFRAPLTEFYPQWSTSQLSLTFTISMICFCLGGFFSGQLLKKHSHKPLLAFAAVILFAGFFGVSMLDPSDAEGSLIKLYIFYGILGGTGVGIGYNSVIGTVNKWFQDRMGLASGIMLLGFGLGGIILGGTVNVLFGVIGIFSTFRVLAVSISVVLILGLLILKRPDAASAAGNKAASDDGENLSPGQMLVKPAFWFFVLWCILLNSAGLLVINNAATIAAAFGAPAVLGLLVSVFNGLGRVFIGGLFDKYGRRKSMLINIGFTCLAGILLLTGSMASATAVIIAGLLFTGLGYGGNPTLSSAFINKEYGPKFFPVNFSICNFSLIPAAIIGPMVSSWLIDSSDGGYTSTFVMIIILAVCAAAAWCGVNRFSGK